MSGPIHPDNLDTVMKSTVAREGGEIGDALGYLGACISRLQDGMERLERRLDPALGPCPPQAGPSQTDEDRPITSELRATLDHQASRVTRLANGLDELLARLEL